MLERSQESATNPETYPQLLNKVTESEIYLLITPDLVSPQKKERGMDRTISWMGLPTHS